MFLYIKINFESKLFTFEKLLLKITTNTQGYYFRFIHNRIKKLFLKLNFKTSLITILKSIHYIHFEILIL
jgi:hypothetical protein